MKQTKVGIILSNNSILDNIGIITGIRPRFTGGESVARIDINFSSTDVAEKGIN